MQKKLDVRMETDTVSAQDPIAVSGLLARSRTTCDHDGVREGAASWCFQLYLTGQAHTLFQTRVAGNTMAAEAGQLERLETYPEVAYILLRTCTTDEVVPETHINLVTSLQGSNMTEES